MSVSRVGRWEFERPMCAQIYKHSSLVARVTDRQIALFSPNEGALHLVSYELVPSESSQSFSTVRVKMRQLCNGIADFVTLKLVGHTLVALSASEVILVSTEDTTHIRRF